MSVSPDVSVLTPTYNRRHTLRRVYDSLLAQTFRNFEWVIVDDGSTDDTAELIEALRAEAEFPITYVRKDNGGRHTAINSGVAVSRGGYLVVMDSDDWMTPTGLERLVGEWRSLPPDGVDSFAAVCGRCALPDGSVIGNPLPAASMDANFVAIRAEHKVRGDMKEMFRTALVRQHPFPQFHGERRVPFSWLLVRLSMTHRVRFIDEVVAYKEYLQDGLTANLSSIRRQSPFGSLVRYQEVVNAFPKAPLGYLFRNYANFVRFSIHAGLRPSEQLERVHAPLLCLIAFPVGAGLYLHDIAFSDRHGETPRRGPPSSRPK